MPSKRLLDELMRYIEFSAEDAALMSEMGPLLRSHFPAVIDHFYQAIDRTPGAAAVFTGGAEQIARQKVMLHGWLEGLVGGVYDEQYIERRARIGRTHVRIALDQRYMFAGMNIVRAELHEGLDTSAQWPLDKLRLGHRAIDRLCDMELAIMLETYREAYIARVKDAERLATIGQVAASIGHELRNPLAVMQTSVQLLARRLPEEERTAKHLRRLCEQITLCNEIISDLLELARDRAPERRPTDLAAVVEEAATSVPRPSEVTLTLQIDAGLPTVAVDPGQFRQLVINLVLNATQAIAGAGRIELRLQVEDRHLVLVVQDTGSGISAEAEARLFEPLFTTRSTGTGLGLALCRRITEKHSGSISAANHPDGGASFVVRVPLTGWEVQA
ncbi:protoglobin domain-containing protein [Nannocystis sp.]|uniref:protoglobin domain-containing protein n=1 Tax=Nannocystis sp. TaxID=1962667 RepID=UPI0024251373|nr:protoglobin domain-containing protein [Nannocystis sp.]MBK7826357.1 histidine kinase [Nannocystis sp.]MBK9757874.1 histidine kinase [Nannocystis sp.]